jgi:predicted secreted protein
MDDIQKPFPNESEPISQQPVGVTPPPAAAFAPEQNIAPQSAPQAMGEPRNFLATFLLACYGGLLGLRHFYLGQKTLGLVRLGLFLAYFLFIILGSVVGSGVLLLLGFLSLTVAYIWAIVDFFVVYLSVKTDADGQELTRTARDSKWAKVIFMVTVILAVIMFVGGVIVGLSAERLFKNNFNSSSSDSFQFESNSRLDGYDSSEFNFDSNSSYDF